MLLRFVEIEKKSKEDRMQLTKGVYGHEFSSKVGPFGLRCGQMRGDRSKITHNSGWYNKLGEKLGFGDLSADDLQRIQTELEDGEFFIVLSEHDSFWNFVTRPGLIGSMSQVQPTVESPGIEYVAENAMFIITSEHFYHVSGFRDTDWERNGISFRHLSMEDSKKLLLSS